MFRLTLTALILATTCGPAHAAEADDAVELFRCTFDKPWDLNFDRWPDKWDRVRGDGYPHYVEIAIVDDETADAGRALRVQLDGGAAASLTPKIPVDPQSSYRGECLVKTGGLKHDRAHFSLTFFDGEQKPLQTFASRKINRADSWRRIVVRPVIPPAGAAWAEIGLHVEPRDRQDLTGWASFDNVRLMRLPRITLKANSPYHLYQEQEPVEVECELTGISHKRVHIDWQLLDERNEVLVTAREIVDCEQVARSDDRTMRMAFVATDRKNLTYAGAATWRPPLPDAGFYRIRAKITFENGVEYRRETRLAVVKQIASRSIGEFGWTLPDGDKQFSLTELAELLPQVGIRFLKFPVWFGAGDENRADELIRFAERLELRHIQIVGLLDEPPADLQQVLEVDRDVSAAHLFSSDPTFWSPSLDPIMTRLSLKIRWWQLGDDRDHSFVGYPELGRKLADLRSQLFRFGQKVNLGLPWWWMAEIPDAKDPTWQFMTFSDELPLAGPEKAAYLDQLRDESVQRWVLVEPLPKYEFSTHHRAVDLIQQMLAAKAHGAGGIFHPDPFDPEIGLIAADGSPGELLLPWRTTAMMLSGAEYIGSIRMPGGSHNYIFARDGQAIAVVWNEQLTEERLYLGEEVHRTDIWGRTTVPSEQEGISMIEVGPVPVFVTGVNEAIIRWRMAVRLERERLPSVFGEPHRNAIQIENFFAQGTGGRVRLVTPDQWRSDPQTSSFNLAVDEQASLPFVVTLPFDATSGTQPIRIDFEVSGDRPYRFSVFRELQIGLGDIEIEATSHIDEHGRLVVEQRLTNDSDEMVDFTCYLYAPNRRRARNRVFSLGTGQDVRRFYFPDGEQLVGETLWLRAEEIDGPRILNYRFEATE